MKRLITLLSIVALFATAGCATVGGAGQPSVIDQMEFVAKNALILYDPSMTEADFEEWVADHDENRRRFVALFNLYTVLVPAVEHDVGALVRMKNDMKKASTELDKAQADFYSGNTGLEAE